MPALVRDVITPGRTRTPPDSLGFSSEDGECTQNRTQTPQLDTLAAWLDASPMALDPDQRAAIRAYLTGRPT